MPKARRQTPARIAANYAATLGPLVDAYLVCFGSRPDRKGSLRQRAMWRVEIVVARRALWDAVEELGVKVNRKGVGDDGRQR